MLLKGGGKLAWQANEHLHNKAMGTLYPKLEMTDNKDQEAIVMQQLLSSSKAAGTLKQYLPIIAEWKEFALNRLEQLNAPH